MEGEEKESLRKKMAKWEGKVAVGVLKIKNKTNQANKKTRI